LKSLIVLASMLLPGCVISSSTSPTPIPSIVVTSRPGAATPTPELTKAWVLTPLGLNVRQDADLQSTRLSTLPQSLEMEVTESRKVGGQTWLHVRAQSGRVEGWVLDSPELVIHRAVAQHIDAGWSVLFPDKWAFKEGNPATFTSPPSDPDGGLLLIQTGDDPARLLGTPLASGKEVRAEAPIEVYGKTTFITIYQLEAGGFEFATTVKSDSKKAFLFDFRQSARAEADTTLFKQLLSSVTLT
jgi:Bacterial SH3 domain